MTRAAHPSSIHWATRRRMALRSGWFLRAHAEFFGHFQKCFIFVIYAYLKLPVYRAIQHAITRSYQHTAFIEITSSSVQYALLQQAASNAAALIRRLCSLPLLQGALHQGRLLNFVATGILPQLMAECFILRDMMMGDDVMMAGDIKLTTYYVTQGCAAFGMMIYDGFFAEFSCSSRRI